jgi:hypothetical protein
LRKKGRKEGRRKRETVRNELIPYIDIYRLQKDGLEELIKYTRINVYGKENGFGDE